MCEMVAQWIEYDCAERPCEHCGRALCGVKRKKEIVMTPLEILQRHHRRERAKRVLAPVSLAAFAIAIAAYLTGGA